MNRKLRPSKVRQIRCRRPLSPAEFAPSANMYYEIVYGQFRTRCRRRIFQPDAPFLGRPHKGENGAGQDEPEAERRNESRRPFRLTQQIAPGYCWEVPPESAWIDVRCYDLAQGGFSFFLDEKPTFERLVARFRSAEPIYVAARVSHWRPVLVDGWGGILDPGTPSAGAVSTVRRTESKFLVGCHFLRRFTP